MSTPQGNSACRISVDPSTADVLRIEDPEMVPHTDSVEVLLTRGHIEQLHERRCDLLATNLDLLTDIGADNQANAIVMSEIYANRHGVEALNKVFDAYSSMITT
jgi:hypothetical protein